MQQQQQRNSLVQELLKSINQQNQSLTNQNKVLHEFQWFELDNQIRIRVHELMEPHLKLFLDQRFEYDTLTVKLEKYIKNYEEFKSIYFQNGKNQSIIQDLKQQIKDLDTHVEQLQQTEQFTIIEINKKLDLLYQQINIYFNYKFLKINIFNNLSYQKTIIVNLFNQQKTINNKINNLNNFYQKTQIKLNYKIIQLLIIYKISYQNQIFVQIINKAIKKIQQQKMIKFLKN